jgi:LPS O-antigen subunit length determinant protein (WzzB/FepE family)
VEENNDITLQSQINAQARTIASQTQTIKERDERIAELESALDAATAEGAANDPVSAPKSSDGGSSAEAENVDEFTAARKFCQFIKSII